MVQLLKSLQDNDATTEGSECYCRGLLEGNGCTNGDVLLGNFATAESSTSREWCNYSKVFNVMVQLLKSIQGNGATIQMLRVLRQGNGATTRKSSM